MRAGRVIAMKKIGFILGIAILALAAVFGWQIGACELANTEFQDDLHDLAAQNASRIGLESPHSDDELRGMIIRIGSERYGIRLDPAQVKVERSGDELAPTFHFSVDYQARAGVPGMSFTVHFTPTSGK
jgi:hypothetical protein